MPLKLQKIIVEQDVASSRFTQKILSRFAHVPVEYVNNVKLWKNGFNSNQLVVAKQKSRFIKQCPGTPIYNCCDYYVLNLGIGCFYSCTYCFLHYYMNSPYLVYVNLEDLVVEVQNLCQQTPNKIFRLGSGEFIDSLGFDELVNFSPFLVESLASVPNLIFELKTKSANINHLLNLNHGGRTVVSWSVNTKQIAEQEERGTACLEARIQAAALCQQAGYKVGFHFDPLIYYPGWEAEYKEVVELIFQSINPQNIAWISLGALRFNPVLKPVIQKKFPGTKIIYGELVSGLDGKLRYFRAIRQKLFRTLVNYIRQHSQDVPVYLCMESKEIAEEVGALAPFHYRAKLEKPV